MGFIAIMLPMAAGCPVYTPTFIQIFQTVDSKKMFHMGTEKLAASVISSFGAPLACIFNNFETTRP